MITSSEVQVFAWLIIIGLVGANGFAAGIAAALHAWAPHRSRPARILTAAIATGLLPASMLLLAAIDPAEFALDARGGGIAFGILFGGGALGGLPGAWILTRRLERARDHAGVFG